MLELPLLFYQHHACSHNPPVLIPPFHSPDFKRPVPDLRSPHQPLQQFQEASAFRPCGHCRRHWVGVGVGVGSGGVRVRRTVRDGRRLLQGSLEHLPEVGRLPQSLTSVGRFTTKLLDLFADLYVCRIQMEDVPGRKEATTSGGKGFQLAEQEKNGTEGESSDGHKTSSSTAEMTKSKT